MTDLRTQAQHDEMHPGMTCEFCPDHLHALDELLEKQQLAGAHRAVVVPWWKRALRSVRA